MTNQLPPLVIRHDLFLLSVMAAMRTVEMVGTPQFRHRMARWAAALAYTRRHRRRERTHLFLKRELGWSDPTALDALVRGTFLAMWRDLFFMCRTDCTAELNQAQVNGLEHIETALANGHGAIIMESAYFGQRNAAKRILAAHGWRGDQSHAARHLGGMASESPTRLQARFIRPFFDRREKQFVGDILTIERDSFAYLRQMAERLKQNHLLYISGDGIYGTKFVNCSFLGKPRPFATGMSSLSRMTGALLIPIFCVYTGAHLQLEIAPPLPQPAGQSSSSAITEYARQLERHIRQSPNEYRKWSELD